MPEICRFLKIIIYMYPRDHEPPHFHAHYQGYRSAWSINDLQIIAGSLPPRIEKIVRQWAFARRDELQDNWKRCQNDEQPRKIAPL
jgi:hypothetical protein